LNLGNWQNALDAALYIHQISPTESMVAALAAFELGRLDEARAWFIHSALNTPRTVAIILGMRLLKPECREEADDHNGGVTLFRSLSDYLKKRTPASRRFFADLWKSEEVTGWRKELEDATRRWREDRGGKDRAAFDRMTEMRTLEFAQSSAAPPGGRKSNAPLHLVPATRGAPNSRRSLVH
ncbi:MAG: hypothetical protein ACT4TC_01370, partial [Myxococcaceae bacterium]